MAPTLSRTDLVWFIRPFPSHRGYKYTEKGQATQNNTLADIGITRYDIDSSITHTSWLYPALPSSWSAAQCTDVYIQQLH